jgi:hypothetical protein
MALNQSREKHGSILDVYQVLALWEVTKLQIPIGKSKVRIRSIIHLILIQWLVCLSPRHLFNDGRQNIANRSISLPGPFFSFTNA